MAWAYIVAPLVGAWIEIGNFFTGHQSGFVAPLVGAWIEIVRINKTTKVTGKVAPLVGAWIEIAHEAESDFCRRCRSPCGSVD